MPNTAETPPTFVAKDYRLNFAGNPAITTILNVRNGWKAVTRAVAPEPGGGVEALWH